MPDTISDALSRAKNYAKEKVVGVVKDLAAKGTTVYSTTPKNSANLDIAKMAQDQADKSLGKRSSSPLNSTMTPIKKR